MVYEPAEGMGHGKAEGGDDCEWAEGEDCGQAGVPAYGRGEGEGSGGAGKDETQVVAGVATWEAEAFLWVLRPASRAHDVPAWCWSASLPSLSG